jgi:hypothetical protein
MKTALGERACHSYFEIFPITLNPSETSSETSIRPTLRVWCAAERLLLHPTRLHQIALPHNATRQGKDEEMKDTAQAVSAAAAAVPAAPVDEPENIEGIGMAIP